MKAYGAVVKKQKAAFAVVLVDSSVIASKAEEDKARAAYEACFPGMPLVFATAAKARGFDFHGSPDLLALLDSMDPWEIPWREYPRAER